MTKGAKTGLLLGGGAILAILAFKGAAIKQAVGQLRYTLKNVSVKMQGLALLVKIDMIVTNPSPTALQFKSFYGKLFLDTVKLGVVDIPQPTLLPPKSDTTVSLSTVLSGTTMINALMDILVSKSTPSKAILDGTLNIGTVQLPVYEQFDMKL
jgi:LEA14-like dessication related protein